ncbi:MAG: PaaI family thioesterase [Candidatus Dormibacteria bacterium]
MFRPENPTWEEPTRGDYPDPRLLALSGADLMLAFTDGRILPPNIHHLTGLVYEESGPGYARFTMPASPWLLPPQGVVSGATLALLADAPLGCAGQTMMPAATPYTTAELSLSFLRPVLADGGRLTGVGRVVHSGRTVVMTEIEITDALGHTVAVGTSRLVTLKPFVLPDGTLEDVLANPPRPSPREWATPAPWQRPVRGEVLPQETWERMSGLEVLRGCISGELPHPPISYLTGIHPVAAEEGASSWAMPASEWTSPPVPGRLYGGSMAHFAGTAIDGAIQTLVPAGTAFAPVDLKVYYLRPVVPDNQLMTAHARVVHKGRSVAIATSEVFDSKGKKAATAIGSAMILPGRAAQVATRPAAN